MSIHDKLISAVTQWDMKQSKRKGYNPHALGIMFGAVEDVDKAIAKGKSVRQAVIGCFNDRLLDHCLKAIGEPISTLEEVQNAPLWRE